LNSQPILLALQQKIAALTLQVQSAAASNQPRGLGKMTSVIPDREIGDWYRFNNRRQVGSYTGLCPGEYSSGNTRVQSCVTKHGKKSTLERGRCPASNLLRILFACVGLDWARPQVPFPC